MSLDSCWTRNMEDWRPPLAVTGADATAMMCVTDGESWPTLQSIAFIMQYHQDLCHYQAGLSTRHGVAHYPNRLLEARIAERGNVLFVRRDQTRPKYRQMTCSFLASCIVNNGRPNRLEAYSFLPSCSRPLPRMSISWTLQRAYKSSLLGSPPRSISVRFH
jgi:hypothetical protein